MEKEKEAIINEVLSRGVERIYPSTDFLKARLMRGEKLTMYLGIDPTGPTLHLGSALNLRKMAALQKLGVKIILLIGDFTAMIGDPTDKSAARKRQSHEEVLTNAALYKEQASHYLRFDGENAAELRHNSEWLGKMSFGDVTELASHFTVQQMLERDMFAKRLKEEKPIYVHEFMYPLMQGYDSVAMDVDGEIGGNDQTFNMLAGRTLLKQVKGKEKFVITMKLLTDDSGKKMGKTEGNMVSLSDSPSEMFGKVMSWTDAMILPGFEFCTDVPLHEIEHMKSEIAGGANPKIFKMRLGSEIVAEYYGRDAANQAKVDFETTFSGGGGIPDDAPSVSAAAGEKLIDVVLKSELVSSKTEFRRLIDENAVSEVGGEKITSADFKIEKAIDIKIGKHRFLKIKVV